MLKLMMECAIRFRSFTSRLDRLVGILDDRGLVSDIPKDVLHICNMHYLCFSSIVDLGDVIITYSKKSASVINIASSINCVTIKRSASDSKVKSGRMNRSLLHKIAEQKTDWHDALYAIF